MNSIYSNYLIGATWMVPQTNVTSVPQHNTHGDRRERVRQSESEMDCAKRGNRHGEQGENTTEGIEYHCETRGERRETRDDKGRINHEGLKRERRGLTSRRGETHHEEREPGGEKEGQAGEHESRRSSGKREWVERTG